MRMLACPIYRSLGVINSSGSSGFAAAAESVAEAEIIAVSPVVISSAAAVSVLHEESIITIYITTDRISNSFIFLISVYLIHSERYRVRHVVGVMRTLALIHRADHRHILVGKFEIENTDVITDMLFGSCFRDSYDTLL